MTEIEKLICDKWLGGGICRNVYEYRLNPKWVVKIALGDNGRKHNLIEDRIWEEIQNSDYAKWFAPVIEVSEAGLYLIMAKVEHGRKQDYPKIIPHFFTDCKYNNYGWIGKNFVSCDYASTIITNGFTKKTKKADWYEV